MAETSFIVDLRQKKRMEKFAASLFRYKQMSLLLLWVTISPKKALWDSLKCLKMQAVGNFFDAGHRVETLFILSGGSKQWFRITLCSSETIYIHSIF